MAQFYSVAHFSNTIYYNAIILCYVIIFPYNGLLLNRKNYVTRAKGRETDNGTIRIGTDLLQKWTAIYFVFQEYARQLSEIDRTEVRLVYFPILTSVISCRLVEIFPTLVNYRSYFFP